MVAYGANIVSERTFDDFQSQSKAGDTIYITTTNGQLFALSGMTISRQEQDGGWQRVTAVNQKEPYSSNLVFYSAFDAIQSAINCGSQDNNVFIAHISTSMPNDTSGDEFSKFSFS